MVFETLVSGIARSICLRGPSPRPSPRGRGRCSAVFGLVRGLE